MDVVFFFCYKSLMMLGFLVSFILFCSSVKSLRCSVRL